MELTVIISGQAGQGVQLLAETLGRALVRQGFYVFGSMDMMSRIRGGHNLCRLRVSTRPVGADSGKARLLVALDQKQAHLCLQDLVEGGLVLTDDSMEPYPDSEHEGHHGSKEHRTADLPPRYEDRKTETANRFVLLQLPLAESAQEQGQRKMLNMVAAGAVFGLLGLDLEVLCRVVEQLFSVRAGDAANRNVACARKGFELVQRRARKGTLALSAGLESSGHPASHESGRVLMTGAQAIALGAVAGGVRFVAGYPMSPGTAILEACAAWQEQAGIVVEQTEDEISAVNMAIGASFAGALGMVATAGGGMCLMNEGLSLAGMTETPLVLVSGMRPGPATGLATRTAQADLLFALSCGHGEFPRAVLCPGNAEEAFHTMQRACTIAAKYQVPVIVLFDQFLGDALWTCEERALGLGLPVSLAELAQKQFAGPYAYRRYEPTDSGVSPLVLPGASEQLVYADSDEHTEEGHITESAEMRNLMVCKRLAKLVGIAAELVPPERYPDADAETIVFCFGSLKGAVREAMDRIGDKEGASNKARGTGSARHTGMVHLCDLWPFPVGRVIELAARAKRFLTVEGNYTAQLAQLIAQETGLRVDGSVRRYDGRSLTVDGIVDGLKELLG